MDSVDEIVVAWGAVQPDLDVSPMRCSAGCARLSELLGEQREYAFAAHGLGTQEFDVLAALRRSAGSAAHSGTAVGSHPRHLQHHLQSA